MVTGNIISDPSGSARVVSDEFRITSKENGVETSVGCKVKGENLKIETTIGTGSSSPQVEASLFRRVFRRLGL